jgi:hypothetical protein
VTEWALQHPWMTFWLLVFLLMAITDIGMELAKRNK